MSVFSKESFLRNFTEYLWANGLGPSCDIVVLTWKPSAFAFSFLWIWFFTSFYRTAVVASSVSYLSKGFRNYSGDLISWITSFVLYYIKQLNSTFTSISFRKQIKNLQNQKINSRKIDLLYSKFNLRINFVRQVKSVLFEIF